MHRYLFGFLLLIFGALASFAGEFNGRVYTAEKSVEDALKNNQSILYAREEVKFAESRVKEANSLVYPLIELESGAIRFDVQELYPLATEVGTVLLDPQMDGSKTYLTAKATLKQVIYGGGKVISTMRMARAFFDKAKSQYEEIHNRIKFDVKSAFYRMLLLKQKELVLQSAYEKLVKLKDLNSNKISGLVMLELMLEINAFEIKLDELQRQKTDSMYDFMSLLNIEMDMPVEFEGDLEFTEAAADLNKCMAWANQFKSELKRTQLQEQIDMLMVNLSVSERYPQILFETGYGFDGLDFPMEKENWTAALTMKLPVFDGWAQWSRIRQKKAQARQGKLSLARTRDEVYGQIRKAYSGYTARANEFFKLSKLKSDADKMIARGLISSAESDKFVVDNVKLIKMQVELEQKYYESAAEANISKFRLEHAVGRALTAEQ